MNPLRRVEVARPPRITLAMGLCNSLPGRSPPSARGMSARAVVSAVIRMGLRRSAEPRNTLSIVEYPLVFKSLNAR